MSAPTANRRFRRRRPEDDAVLLARARAGDDRAFAALYDRYAGLLLAFSRSLVQQQQDAEDVVQHVFVALHRRLGDDDRALHLKPWLYAAARNRSLDVLRTRRAAVDLDEVDVGGRQFAGEVEQREDLRALLRDVQRLPEDQRGALVLTELGDLTHDEVAAVLDVRKDKVKALVFQARKALLLARDARELACSSIQEELAVATGAALRRRELRAHVEQCAACAAFKEDVQRQRVALGLVLPVVPALALKHAVLDAALGGGAAAVAGGALGGGGATAAGSGTVGAGAVVAGSGLGGAATVTSGALGGASTVGGGAAVATGAAAAGGAAAATGGGVLSTLAGGGLAAKAAALVAVAAGGAGGVAAVRSAGEPERRAPVSTVTTAPPRATPAAQTSPTPAATPSSNASPKATATPSRTRATTRRSSAGTTAAAPAAPGRAKATTRRAAAQARRVGRKTAARTEAVTQRGPAATRPAPKAKAQPATPATTKRATPTQKQARQSPPPQAKRPPAGAEQPPKAKGGPKATDPAPTTATP